MSYQTIVRNAGGALITNTNVGIKISVLQTSVAGTVVYAETHNTTTNANGLASLQIGAGNVVSGVFTNINWANDIFFLKSETDPSGGNNYTLVSTTQLLSVPYALYAATSGSSIDGWKMNGNTAAATDFIGTNNAQPLKFKVNNLPFGILDISSNSNIGLGQNTLINNTTGVNAVAIGTGSLAANTTGNGNTATGWNALNANTIGGNNVAIGIENLRNNTVGNYNTGVGAYTLKENISGIENVAIGSNALRYNITGKYNTTVGANAMNLNSSGFSNTALGYAALRNNTNANYNTALGYLALSTNATGSYNTAIGTNALNSINDSSNIGIGYKSGYSLGSGNNNTIVGNNSVIDLTTGSNNVVVGSKTSMPVGSYNTILGANASIASNRVNSTAIGYNAYCASSNAIVLGSGAYVGVGTSYPITSLDVDGEILAHKRFTIGGYQKDPTTTPTWSFDNYNNMFRIFRQDNISTPGNTHFSITNDGRVLIGTLDTSRALDYKLIVNGKTICNELRVQNTANWPDFVFEKSFSLMPINKLNKYVKTYKHLPNIPSATEIESKKNVDVGDMQKRLLQKIEELTLYIIDLEQRLQKIEKSN